MQRRDVLAAAMALAAAGCARRSAGGALLNASYDPTRELYQDLNAAFLQTQGGARIEMSHGGSGRQARAVIDGLRADVVTLALAPDIDALAERGLVAAGWRERLPNGAVPFLSTIVFLVRPNNPKNIAGWADLVRGDVAVITPNPKTSGGARWNYLAALAWAKAQPGWNEAAALDYMRALYARVPVLDTGARGSTTTFAQRGLGDVLITWESEAFLAQKEFGAGAFEMIAPNLSIRAEPPIAMVDAVVEQKGSRDRAEAYLAFHYEPAIQALAAEHGYRPVEEAALAAAATRFPDMNLVSVDEAFGSWAAAQATHFAEGGAFDQLTAGKPR